ncbi:helix-turn-helix domain-containing protein [Desulfuromonas sp. TF]|uniref:helix-turn-helix domain-containing protein n=1 Tax=Desulfuromonas sp. TF TaxID=1232410 RepID=UPI00042142DE|nr:helix-turn-helix domain-containing protein [Desulfuromonas sp. TF]
MKKNSEKPDGTLEKIIGDPALRREWIKFQLRIHGSSLADLAKELGTSRQAVRDVFNQPYPKMQKAIAAKIGMRPEAIWPERYQKAA